MWTAGCSLCVESCFKRGVKERVTNDSCFGCRPTPTVAWTRVGLALSERSSVPADEFGQELVISDVQPEDSGRYQCRASNSVGSAVAHVITLTVEC